MIEPETPLLTDAELADLPVFPLPAAVLFPGTSIGLHLFEPRYRALMRHCLEKGPRAMAIAHLRPGLFEADYAGQPPIFEIAGAGRIVSHRGNADGTFDLILEGTQRVRLHELPFVPPFRRARAESVPDVNDDETALNRVAEALGLAELLRSLVHASPVPIAPNLPSRLGRQLDFAANQLVRDPALRQELLETTDAERRAMRVHEIVRGQSDRERRRRMN